MKIFNKIARRQTLLMLAVLAIAGLLSFGAIYKVSAKNRASAQSKCKDTCVSLYADKASPNTIAVKVGSYVQFNSADGKTHDLSQGEGGAEHVHTGKFHSGDFGADEAWRVQFKDEGSYYFHDHLNPKINILVVVYTPGKQYKIK